MRPNTRQIEKMNLKRQIQNNEHEQWLSKFENRYYGCNCQSCNPSWKDYTDISMYTTGGKLITSMMRLGILEGGDPTSRKTRGTYHHQYELLEHLATNDEGLI